MNQCIVAGLGNIYVNEALYLSRIHPEKFGCKIKAPLSESEYPGADGNIVHVRSVGVFDPDGHFFECNQRL